MNNNNKWLEFYGNNYISPVEQDIADISVHYAKRRKLYRQLGIPQIAFRNASVLEVGAGGGTTRCTFSTAEYNM